MNNTASLIHSTVKRLSEADPELHAEVRQNLYQQLDLSFDKQLSLYSHVLGPASAGRISDFDKAVDTAFEIIDR